MTKNEDGKLALRWFLGRPVETLLLVIGISLGIGATSAGIALAWRTSAQARETLASVQYREIVVSVRESAEEMDAPAVKSSGTESVVLTTSDLAAGGDAEDIQYAYVANRMDLRFGVQAPPDAAQSGVTESPAAPPEVATVTLDGPTPVLEEVRGYEVTPEFFAANDLSASQGSLFSTEDMKKGEPMLVLGSSLASTLFEDGQSLGRQLLSRNQLYTIVGILEPTGTASDSQAFSPAVMAELQGLEALARGRPSLNTSLHFTVGFASRLEQAKAQLQSWFDSKYGEGSTVVSVPRYQAEATRDRTARLVTVILFLALSALLIAAVNVTNILSSRVLRKRRAVGILKALGASVHGVFRLFLREALLIGFGGAAVGTGLSILMSRLMRDTMGSGSLTLGLLALGIAGAAALVTALDVLPALQASRVPASEAIRYE